MLFTQRRPTFRLFLASLGLILASSLPVSAGSTTTVSIDRINGQSAPFKFSCPENPLTNPVRLEGRGAGTAPPGQIEQYKVQIDWGDGTVDDEVPSTFTPSSGQGDFTFTFSAGPHSYATAGSKTISTLIYHAQTSGGDNQDISPDAAASVTVCTVSETAPAPSPAPSPTPSPAPSPTAGGTASAPTAPFITDVRASAIDATTERITWRTSSPASSQVEYGMGGSSTRSPSDATLVTSHEVILSGLAPATTYTYIVMSSPSGGAQAMGPAQFFLTRNLAPSPDNDKDNDGMLDAFEMTYALDPKVPADAAQDADNDGLSNVLEYQLGSNPKLADTDDDGMPDKWEADHDLLLIKNDASEDPDADGASNLEEYNDVTDPHSYDARSGAVAPRCGIPWWWILLAMIVGGLSGYGIARRRTVVVRPS